MNTVGETIVFASRQLTDQRKNREFTRWNRKDLLNYMNNGLKEIAAYRAEAFARTVEIQLAVGSRQKSILGATLVGLTNKATGMPLNETDAASLKAFMGFNICQYGPKWDNGKATYTPRAFSIDPDNAEVFYISPGVPEGFSPVVLADIQGKAPEYTFQDWNKTIEIRDSFYNNLIDWMMAEAYAMDTESQVSLAQSRGLKQAFYSIMGVKYKMDSARVSGFYEGRTGTGDPRAAAL